MSAAAGGIEEYELSAYLDRQLPSDRAVAVAAWLAAHPQAQARLNQYAEQQHMLRQAIAAQSAGPIPAGLRVARLAAVRHRRRSQRLTAAAAAVLLLVLGGAGGWTARNAGFSLGSVAHSGGPAAAQVRALAADAIDAHRVFSVEIRHPVEVDAEHEAHLVQWLSKRLGHPLVVPNLSKLGFQLMGGRLLPSENGPAAQLMYDNGKGSRLTAYVQPVGFTGGTEFQYRRSGGVGTFYWSEEGFGYAIAGDADRDLLLKAAEIVYRQINEQGGKAKLPPPPGKAS